MAADQPRAPLRPGEPAPDFTLPTVHRDGCISLADYRGNSAVLLVLLRGLWCSFCRRHLVQLAGTREQLRALGVETLAIVATDPQRARLYFRFHPAPVPVAADPELVTHRAYGVPKPTAPELQALLSKPVLVPELAQRLTVQEAGDALHRLNPYQWTTADEEETRRVLPLLIGQFLIDRNGIVRWVNIEGAKEGPSGISAFPTDEEFVAATRLLPV
jgi:peroxiredoxin